MTFLRLTIITLSISSLVFGIIACSDDDSITEPQVFSVTVSVTDIYGAPVPGLELSIVPETPYYADGKTAGSKADIPPIENRIRRVFPNPFCPVTSVQFDLNSVSHARLCIEDIEGTEVCLIANEPMAMGSHTWHWNSRDDNGDPVISGVYRAHLVLTDPDDDTVLLDDYRFILMAAWGTQYGVAGTTNDNGEIVLTDKRVFPFLYNIGEMEVTDETGASGVMFELTADTRFYLTDPTDGTYRRFNRDITGTATLEFTWVTEPSPLVK